MTYLISQRDFNEINLWRHWRGLDILSRDFYPNTGLMVHGVAAGWLVETDSKVALLENFISNPKAYKQERMEAVKEIGHDLAEYAKRRGYTKLFIITNSGVIEKYALEEKYEKLGTANLFAKEI